MLHLEIPIYYSPAKVAPGPMWHQATVLDHRSAVRTVKLRRQSDWFAFAASHATSLPVRFFAFLWKPRAAGGIVIAPMVVITLIREIWPIGNYAGEMYLLAALFAVPLLLVILVARLVPQSQWAPDAARQLLEARSCPCCHYSLDGLLPEQDGASICPECGAAWMIYAVVWTLNEVGTVPQNDTA